jgi:hypothetical protein
VVRSRPAASVSVPVEGGNCPTTVEYPFQLLHAAPSKPNTVRAFAVPPKARLRINILIEKKELRQYRKLTSTANCLSACLVCTHTNFPGCSLLASVTVLLE